MDSKLKVGAFNKIMNAIKHNPNIDQVSREDTGVMECVTCKICGGISFEMRVMNHADLATLKAEAHVEAEEEEKLEIAGEIANESINGAEESFIKHTMYDDTIIFQLNVPFADADGVEGQKMIFNNVLGFINLMCRHKDKLGCSMNKTNGIAVDFTTEAEDDPFGFNDYSDSEDDESASQTAAFDPVLEEDPKEDILAEESNTEEGGDDGSDSVDFFQMLEKEDEQKEEDHKAKASDSSGYDADDLFQSFFGDVEEQPKEPAKPATKAKKKPHRETPKAKEGGSKKQPVKQNAQQAESGDDVVTRMKKKQEERRTRRKPAAAFGDSKEVSLKTENVSDSVVGNTAVIHTDTPCTSKEPKKETVAFEPKQQEICEKNGDACLDSSNSPKYERAPEVVEQMRHLYEEIDHVFNQRKKQADFRENTLNDFSNMLDAREESIKQHAADLEQTYQMKLKEVEDHIIDLEKQKQELEFQWTKLDAERDNLAHEKKDLDESVQLFERSRNLESTFIQTGKIAELEDAIREKDKKISRLEKENSVRSPKGAKYQDNGRIAEMQKQIDLLNKEIEELNADVDELILDASKKEAELQKVEEEKGVWEQRANELEKKASKLSASAGASDQSAQLKEDLAVANKKIKELEEKAKSASSDSGSLEKELKMIKGELMAAKQDLEKADKAYEQERKEKEDLLASQPAARDSKQEATKIKEALSEIGVEVEAVATNGDLVLSGISDGIQVVVNVDAKIIYFEKAVKRSIAYNAQFSEWNQEDVRTSFITSKGKVICKYAYEDVAKAAVDVLGRFKSLK